MWVWPLAVLLFLLLGDPVLLLATHNRAGEIVYEHVQGFTYKVTIITYTKQSSVSADRDSLEISWGDGLSDTLPRVNGGGNGVSLGNDIKYNEYVGFHTYPALGTYVLSVTDPNRIAGIININGGNSVNEPFYIEDTLRILDPAFFGYNSSPRLLNPPIDFANVNVAYYHNPNAYDPDGDSLTFEFIIPRKAPNLAVANYVDPHLIPGTPPGQTFTIDRFTGMVEWNVPLFVGTYNFAILVREYRNGICIGTLVRDLQVIVDNVNNLPPVISQPRDTCVVAGTLLTVSVSATDPNPGQQVKITSNGGPYEVPSSPAIFSSAGGQGTFTWQTTCDHVRAQFYQVVFKAQDNYYLPLVDLTNWLIRVVAPAPQNVQAVAQSNAVQVSWQQPYDCAAATRFIGFSVWRKEGSNPFSPDSCEVGLAGKGYEKIAEHLFSYSFTDVNVIQGKQYCYRVLAEFADKALSQTIPIYYNNVYSLPSAEACSRLPKSVPIITQVSVEETNVSDGTMLISWSPPDALELDTLLNPPPYRYVLQRAAGNGLLLPIDTLQYAAFYLLTDSQYIDNGLNTRDVSYRYNIRFFSGSKEVGASEVASSIFLQAVGKDKQAILTWTVDVPWTNTSFTVYRRNSSGIFDSIGTTSLLTFTDVGLENGVEQCYRVRSRGQYSISGVLHPIYNFSQEQCVVPVDSIAPCPPMLEVYNFCNSSDFPFDGFVNQLIWSFSDPGCADDVYYYEIFFAPKANEPLQWLARVEATASLSYLHEQPADVKGCYGVVAVDEEGNRSAMSGIVCVDNCPFYELPNVFTPNGDGANDVYHPFLPFRFVDRIDLKIFDGWGTLVYATTDPLIRWDGHDIKNGKPVPEGTYYFLCDVYNNQVRMGPTRSGFIHVFR